MRHYLAALLCLATALPAAAGTVTIYTPSATHTVSGTSYVSTNENTGDFTIIGATVSSSGPPSSGMKVKGYTGFVGGVTTLTASVTFQNCVLLNFQGAEAGLLHYEIFCFNQTGSF